VVQQRWILLIICTQILGKGFIKAIDARTKRALGKNYLLKNRDGLEIVTR